MKPSENFSGIVFKQYRERLGLTQEELAEKLGITFQTLQNWESGRTKPNKTALFALQYLEGLEPDIPISEKCQLLREKLGITKTSMANKFNVDLQTWSYWEKGKQKPGKVFRKRILEMLEETKKQQIQNP